MRKEQFDIIPNILGAIDDKLGKDPVVLDVNEITSICDYFVIASASSSRQVKAIVDEIEHKLLKEDIQLIQKEGYDSARWVLLDYGHIVIHIFHEEDRAFYNLEGIWKDANKVNIDMI